MLASLSLAAANECVQIEGARIRASDLAVAVPAFAGVDPVTDYGPAPAGSLVRFLHRPQLLSLLGPEASVPEQICVERKRAVIPESVWQEALQRVIAHECPAEQWKLELKEYSRHPLPAGELVFTRAGLGPHGAGETAVWRGALRLPDRISIPVWARVSVRILRRAAILATDLAMGSTVGADSFHWEQKWVPANAGASFCAEAAWHPEGLTTRRNLKAGTELTQRDVRQAPAVRRGEVVDLETISGRSRLRMQGIAVGNAAVGEAVGVTSSWNGRVLTARVTGVRKAVVD